MIDVVIPCLNEQETIGPIVSAFGICPLIRSVVVVDNGSEDDTVKQAWDKGATIRTCSTKGKGQAILVGMTAVTTRRVILCDGDLTGLRPGHVGLLMRHQSGMTIGVPDFTKNVPWYPNQPEFWDFMSGIRYLPSRLIRSIPDLHGYCTEVQINQEANKARLPVRLVRLNGVKGTPRDPVERVKAYKEDGEWLRCKIEKTLGLPNT
jgi:glycosyltransferase involved in cell wall biosynthesis